MAQRASIIKKYFLDDQASSDSRIEHGNDHPKQSIVNCADRDRPITETDVPNSSIEDLSYSLTETNDGRNFHVVIRVRPPVPRELDPSHHYVNIVRIGNNNNNNARRITLCETLDIGEGKNAIFSRQVFSFDYVYSQDSRQEEVYETSAKPAVFSVLQGYNATLIAYGQTGTGKTYTMEGFTSELECGIIPRSVEEIFRFVESKKNDRSLRFTIKASFMQIYNEILSDLLATSEAKTLLVRHTPREGVFVDGLSEWVVKSPLDVYGLIEKGTSSRATSATRLCEISSRSHAIFTISVKIQEENRINASSCQRYGKLNIVDLAGSEKVRQSGVTGQRLEETKKINKSLHELGNVISALASRNRHRHIPFRNSVLTSVLRDSLGGNCKTTLIACISPALESYAESLSTLMFADRAKHIQNNAVVNEEVDSAALLVHYEKEMKRLQHQLQEKNCPSSPNLSEVSEEAFRELQNMKDRAETDREVAFETLRKSSLAHAEEMEYRQTLEQRVLELEQQLKRSQHERLPIRSFAGTGGDLVSENLSGVDAGDHNQSRYPDSAHDEKEPLTQILQKQREIIFQLTSKLQSRDEVILELQEELEVYDSHVRDLEVALDQSSTPLQATELNVESERALVNPISIAKRCPFRCDAKELAESNEALRNCRIMDPNGGFLYRSTENASVALTADEKILELILLLRRKSKMRPKPLMSPISPLSESEVLRLRQLMDSRAETLFQRWKMEKSFEELDRICSISAKIITDAKENSVSSQDESLKLLTEVISRERDAREKLALEVDRLKFELQYFQETCQSVPDHQEKISRLWQALESIEEKAYNVFVNRHFALADSKGPPNSNSTAKSNTPLQHGDIDTDKSDLRTLIDSSSAEKESREMMTSNPSLSLSDKHGNIDELRAQLKTQLKDRRSIQLIMEKRIKKKVDSLFQSASLLSDQNQQNEPHQTSLDRDATKQILTESKSLKDIVDATIKALSVIQ